MCPLVCGAFTKGIPDGSAVTLSVCSTRLGINFCLKSVMNHHTDNGGTPSCKSGEIIFFSRAQKFHSFTSQSSCTAILSSVLRPVFVFMAQLMARLIVCPQTAVQPASTAQPGPAACLLQFFHGNNLALSLQHIGG